MKTVYRYRQLGQVRLIFFDKVQSSQPNSMNHPFQTTYFVGDRTTEGADKIVADQTLNHRLETAQYLLSELLCSATNLLPTQQQLLTRVLDNLTHASGEIDVTLAELALNQQELSQRLEQEQRVGALTQCLHQSLDLHDIINTTASGVQQLLQADRVMVYHFRSVKGEATAAENAAAHCPSWLDTLPYQTWLKTITEQIAPESYAILDVKRARLPAQIANIFRQKQIKGMLIIPIVREGLVLGTISVHQCFQVRQWDPLELKLLKTIADQAAIALQQSELYQQVQYLNADLEQQIQQRTIEVQKALDFESTLKRITDKVRDSLDENQILQTAVQELTLVLGLGGCNSAIYDLNQGISTICYEYTDSVPAYQGRVAHMDHFPEIYNQLQQGHYFQFCSLVPNPVRGQVSMLACPILGDSNLSPNVEQVVLGDLWLIHHTDHVFTEFEIRLVQQVANQCAIAIRQARLFQAAQVQVQELEKLNRLKDEFLSTVSHELRTPITNVKMAIHMLKISSDEERRQRCMRILETETAREAELIDELLDLQRLESATQPIILEETQVQDWLPNLIEPFRSRIASQQQILKIDYPPDLPPFVTDVSVLRRIFTELLNNACKYTVHAGAIALTICVEPHATRGTTTVITVSNQADIPPTELPHIFDKFYRVIQIDRYKQGGTGLGLALAQKRVEQLSGSIKAESTNGWTTFTIRLPAL